MSSGEVTVKVKAEGVDDAADAASDGVAAEMPDGEDDASGDMPDGDEDSGGDIADQLGSIGRTLGLATALLAALGPLREMLEGVLNVLSAFLAPLAMMLMRIFQPVLRLLIQLLPAWFDFMDDVDGWLTSAVDFISSLPGRIWSFMRDLPGMIWSAIENGASWLKDGAVGIGKAVWSEFESGASWLTNGIDSIGESIAQGFKNKIDWFANLPSAIASAIKGDDIFDDESDGLSDIGDGIDFGRIGRDAAIGAGGGALFGPKGAIAGGLLGGGSALVDELLASGGVVTEPTSAIIGEAGPEAVIPLDRFERMMGEMQGGTHIELRGGLSEFVSGARRDPNIDI